MRHLISLLAPALALSLAPAGALAQDAFAGAAQAEDRFTGPMATDERMDASEIEASGWTTAPAVGGAVSWTVFGTTREVLVEEGDGRVVKPEFSEEVRALEGRTVRVNGYMMPLEQSLRQSHFLILAYPLHCPFCVSAGPTQMVEVEAADPVEFKYDAQLVEGRLVLMQDDENGMYYKLVDARKVEG